MSRGRKAIPAALKDKDAYKNTGVIDRQKDRTPGQNAKATLRAPKWLSEGARAEWARVVRLYKEADMLGILNNLDQAVMIAYTTEVDIRDTLIREWEKRRNIYHEDVTETERKKDGPKGVEETTGKSKRKMINPLLREIERHNQTVRVLAEQLALTPAGRAAYAAKEEKSNRGAVELFMDDE